MGKIKSFEDLVVWKEAHLLTLNAYKITSNFPKEEIYGLTSQLRRASSSIPTNIAEGSGRFSTKEYIQFLNIARGSLEETKYLLILSKDLGYIKEEIFTELLQKSNVIGKRLNSLISVLREKA